MSRSLNGMVAEVTRLIFDVETMDHHKINKIEELLRDAYEDGYDQAATDITLKIQSCIPSKTPTVHAAQLQGAWRDAAKIALNHVGKLSNPNYPEEHLP